MQKMNVCRICLSSSPEKDLCHLNSVIEDDVKGYEEVLFFCLDIQVTEDSKITRKLCMKCYGNILSFYKFKSLALKNDAYLKNLANCVVTLVQLVSKKDVNASNPLEDCNEIGCDSSIVKEEPEIKEENVEIEVLSYQSDEDPLSVIKEIKYETKDNVTNGNVTNGNLTNGQTKGKASEKKQGPQKLIKANSNKSVVCGECGQSVRNLNKHALTHIPLKDRKRFKCKACDKTFNNYKSRSKHYRSLHLGLKKHCNICNKDYVDLKLHKLTIHNPEKMRYACAVCGGRYHLPSALQKHMLIHNKEKPHECDICHAKFRHPYNLKLHRRAVHDKERTFICQYCSKSFFRKPDLVRHLRTHTKEKPYKCPECGRRFANSTTLNNHKRIHTGLRNYRCKYCNKGFTTSSVLYTHQKIHTTEKIHPCRYCGVKFRRTDQRRVHEVTAHEKHFEAA